MRKDRPLKHVDREGLESYLSGTTKGRGGADNECPVYVTRRHEDYTLGFTVVVLTHLSDPCFIRPRPTAWTPVRDKGGTETGECHTILVYYGARDRDTEVTSVGTQA